MRRISINPVRVASLVVAPALLVGGIAQLATAPAAGAATGAAAMSARGSYTAIPPSYDDQVLAATNAARRAHGLAPLRASVCVDGFATSWARYLAVNNAFRHQSLRPVLVRCHHRTAGENIAYSTGAMSAARVVDLWMHSPGHRANILDRSYRYLGVDAFRSGSGRTYVVQDFAG